MRSLCSAAFKRADRVLGPQGFYDGDGLYRIRFMPDTLGPMSRSSASAPTGPSRSRRFASTRRRSSLRQRPSL